MSTTKVVLPAADCEAADTAKPQTKEPVKLCMFMEPLTAAETIERTLKYAKNPKEYLIETLGEEEFERKKDSLCIPTEVNLDFYGGGTTKQHFEHYIAKFLGKKHGRFFLTGVQAQLAAMKIHAERAGRNKVAWHVSSHLETAEQEAYSKLYGLDRVLLGSRAEGLPTVEEIQSVLAVPEQERPAAILIEIPNRVLGCETYTFPDLVQIADICKKSNVALHCDGARLWEIEPYYTATARIDFIELCSIFDSVYVSFYKGLGGITGAMLVHNDPTFIDEAKLWQRRAGGNSFSLGVEVLDCQRGFNEMVGTFRRKREKMIDIVEGITAATKDFKTAKGESIVGFVPAKATCAQIVTEFRGYSVDELVKARDRVQEKTGVQVFPKLRSKQTLDERMKPEPSKDGDRVKDTDGKVGDVAEINFMEWMIMSVTEKIEDHVFVNGYVDLCKELVATKSLE